MKKTLAILVALVLAAALFAGCATKPAEQNDATEKPAATDVPVVTDAPAPTDVPVTQAPTATPAPTAEPFNDPYKVEITDWDDAEVRNFSFDTIKVNGKTLTDGGVATYRLEIEDTIDGTDGSVKTVTMRGWAGLTEEEIIMTGYQIDDGAVVLSDKNFEATSDAVKAAGGDYAIRFSVDIPVEGLAGQHELKVVLKTPEGLYYMNPMANPFVLMYEGVQAADNALDGVITAGEYSAKYVLDASNAQTWTGTSIGDRSIEYRLDLESDGLYVGCTVKGAAIGDMIQLNFNPGARLDGVPGRFISFKLEDGKVIVLQHNHKTQLKDDDNAGGADITELVGTAYAAGDGAVVFEAKLPIELFKVTDVEKADQFDAAKENLYFGMFVVMGGGGYTNQSSAPGSSWLCKDLGIHEYFI